jgi:hypothetical protein
MHSDLSAVSTANFHPLAIAVSIPVAGEILDKGRSTIYELLGLGKLRAVKDGDRTLVLIESIKEYQASLPVGTFAPPRPHRLANRAPLPRRRRRKAAAK